LCKQVGQIYLLAVKWETLEAVEYSNMETSLLDDQLTAPNRRSTETVLCFATLIV